MQQFICAIYGDIIPGEKELVGEENYVDLVNLVRVDIDKMVITRTTMTAMMTFKKTRIIMLNKMQKLMPTKLVQ